MSALWDDSSPTDLSTNLLTKSADTGQPTASFLPRRPRLTEWGRLAKEQRDWEFEMRAKGRRKSAEFGKSPESPSVE